MTEAEIKTRVRERLKMRKRIRMPSGHTRRQTLTPYRRALLERMPLDDRLLRRPERNQVNQMAKFGWVNQCECGHCDLSREGKALTIGYGVLER